MNGGTTLQFPELSVATANGRAVHRAVAAQGRPSIPVAEMADGYGGGAGA